MTDIELKRFGRPIDLNDRRKKILEYVADIYSKNFNGKTIPLNKLNIVDKSPNFISKTFVNLTQHFDIISCKMYENVVNPSNICKSFAKSFESYDGGDW